MTWEEFQKANQKQYDIYNTNRRLVNIDCPKCGKKIYIRTDIILSSNPPKSQYECDCGWVGYN